MTERLYKGVLQPLVDTRKLAKRKLCKNTKLSDIDYVLSIIWYQTGQKNLNRYRNFKSVVAKLENAINYN